MPDSSSDLENPYAISTNEDLQSKDGQQHEVGYWRQGDLLVVHVHSEFPPFCVKTGESASGKGVGRRFHSFRMLGFAWHSAEFVIPLSASARTKRLRMIAGAWVAAIVTIPLFSLGEDMLAGPDSTLFLGLAIMGASLLVFLVAMFVGIESTQVVESVKVTHEFAWIRKVHVSVLDRLEEFPYSS